MLLQSIIPDLGTPERLVPLCGGEGTMTNSSSWNDILIIILPLRNGLGEVHVGSI